MQTVWVVVLADYGQVEFQSGVEAVCASQAAADRYIAGYIRSQPPDADWRTNRQGYKGNWTDKNGLSFEVTQMQVLS